MNRLDKSLYAANASGMWTGEAGHYDLTNITYDKNGNIQTLNRYAEAGNTRVALDQLTYGYGANGNKLTSVEDAADAGFGFKNGTAGIPTEYAYDANGNLTSDLNKGIISITYSDLNLPKVIEFSDGKRLEFSYDASGYAYRKQLKQGSTILRTVDYVQGIQYIDNALTLVITPAGRAVKNGSSYEYEYFLKDHLGNTRVVYGYLHDTDTYKVTMEAAYATDEEADFKNISTTRHQDASHNHTRKNLDVPVPDRSAETNGYLNKPVGPAKMLQVSAGDKVKLEVFAKYITSTAGSTAIISNLLAAVTSTFGIINAGETQTAYQALNNNLGGTLSSIVPATNTPKAYLYYILFNSDYTYNQFGYYSVPQEALLGYVPLTLNITVPANGFLYTYVANESNISAATSVYFDDFTIIHEKTTSSLRVVESIDYDPFGMVLEGTHYVDESRPLNSYLYQGDYSEYDNQSGWHRFAARGNYDASLGRWFSTDPANQFASPYLGMANNPTSTIDPDGRFAWFLPVIAGAAVGGVIGGIIADRNGQDWYKGAIVGAFMGASVGLGIAAEMGATGIASGASATAQLTKAWGYASTAIQSANLSMLSTAVNGGTLDNIYKSGLVGASSGLFTVSGGFGLVKQGFFGRLGYQMIGSAGRSIGKNWAAGRDLYSKITLGVGPVNLTLGKDQDLIQADNNIGNIATNSFGLVNLAFGGSMDFNWKHLTPIYGGGLIDKFFGGTWGAHAILYRTDQYDQDLINHELHHIWQSRSFGDDYLYNYLGQGLLGLLIGKPFKFGHAAYYSNYFENQAYYYQWFK